VLSPEIVLVSNNRPTFFMDREGSNQLIATGEINSYFREAVSPYPNFNNLTWTGFRS
jgi:hypothetical protein